MEMQDYFTKYTHYHDLLSPTSDNLQHNFEQLAIKNQLIKQSIEKTQINTILNNKHDVTGFIEQAQKRMKLYDEINDILENLDIIHQNYYKNHDGFYQYSQSNEDKIDIQISITNTDKSQNQRQYHYSKQFVERGYKQAVIVLAEFRSTVLQMSL